MRYSMVVLIGADITKDQIEVLLHVIPFSSQAEILTLRNVIAWIVVIPLPAFFT